MSAKTGQNPRASGSDACGYGFSGRTGAPLAAAVAAALAEAPGAVGARAPVRGACAERFFGVFAGAGAATVTTIGIAAGAEGAPIVLKPVGVMTGGVFAADSAVASAAFEAAVEVPFAGCLPPLSKRRSCGQKRATEPTPTARTSAAIPMRNGKPLRACSGAALRMGGRLGVVLPGA